MNSTEKGKKIELEEIYMQLYSEKSAMSLNFRNNPQYD